jgi:hypothetical protein
MQSVPGINPATGVDLSTNDKGIPGEDDEKIAA